MGYMAGVSQEPTARYPTFAMPVLNEAKIRSARPQERAYKLFDERGLFMLVTPTGGRLWRFRYRLGGVEKLLTLGAYPDVTLKRAREKREDARKLVADGVDPSAKRKAEKALQADTFEAIAREWLALQSKCLATETMEILGTSEELSVSVCRQPSHCGHYCARTPGSAPTDRGTRHP